ncbi:MAG: ornithine carbamoyltransferase [bacterium]|nr:ornithine carbamoyltransferase [bacterium]
MRIPKLKTNHLLTVMDLDKDEIIDLFNLAKKLKKDVKKRKCRNILKGQSLAMIFEKSSTRTRVSFETGMTQLGGHSLFLSADDIQLGRGETIADTARVMSRYVDGIMIRTFSHEEAQELAANSEIPVINGLTDSYHPCQTLTDYFTIYEREDDLKNVKLAYIGDGNNMANSLLLGAAILGTRITIASPKKYSPDLEVIETAYKISALSGAKIDVTDDIDKAVEGANYIYTDVWVSMGQEKEVAKRKKAFTKFKITKKLLEKCAPGCKVMHCLPAHRGEEIDADVLESDQSIVFDQAENRLHVQKAVMCALMKK